MADKFIIENFLSEEFGLSKREVTLYLNLIRYGASTIQELAEISGMNRSTTHVNVDSLTRKGLVSQLCKGRGSRRLISAEPTEKLGLLFKNKRLKIESAEQHFPEIATKLAALEESNLPSKTIEVRRYKGKDEVRLIYEDILKAQEIRSYANLAEVEKYFPGNLQIFCEAHKKNKKMRIWEIMEDCPQTREYVKKMSSERFSCRLTTQKLRLASIDYLLFDGKIAVIEASKGISGIVIQNKNLYDNEKAIHEFVWNSLPPYEG